jgi:L-methionine (R)-S-oxide reductase
MCDWMDAGQLIKGLQDMRDEGHLSDALLRKAVREISDDERFDWVGVYLLNDDDEELWLHNYIGEPTDHAKIAVGEGVCGRAVAERTNQNVPDVSQEENYLACSPDTQSELVILIRAGEDIFGQIDIDSDQKEAFTEEDEIGLIGVADKLAEQLAAERRDAN